MAAPLRPSFFDRPTPRVARELLGTQLRTWGPDGRRSVRLVEVEAYVARDPANHADRGPTRRNRSMFGPPGTLYVYRIHRVACANVVTRPGQAVLFRAGAPIEPERANPSGPGRLSRVLSLGIADDGRPIGDGRWEIVRDRPPEPAGRIALGPRVGVSRAAERPLRFAVRGDPWVSRPRPT